MEEILRNPALAWCGLVFLDTFWQAPLGPLSKFDPNFAHVLTSGCETSPVTTHVARAWLGLNRGLEGSCGTKVPPAPYLWSEGEPRFHTWHDSYYLAPRHLATGLRSCLDLLPALASPNCTSTSHSQQLATKATALFGSLLEPNACARVDRMSKTTLCCPRQGGVAGRCADGS